jgi:uncharacterized protein YbjT (DUF2867 family)
MAKKMLVTGGNIGDPAISYLIKKGEKIKVPVRSIKPNAAWDQAGVEQVLFDYDKPDTLKKAFEGVDRYLSVSPMIENMVETAAMAFEYAKKAGVEKIVRTSALGASENAPITLGKWHGQIEKSLKSTGITHTIFQPASFMQNYLMSSDSIKTQGAFYAPLGEGKASLIDVRDLGMAAAIAMTSSIHDGRTYLATGSESVSASNIAATFSEVLGKQIKYVDVPESAAEDSMKKMGLPAWMIKCLMELNQITKAGYVADVSHDLESVLGRKQNSFFQFVKEHVQFFKN